PLMLPAVGQGALGIETRSDNRSVGDLLLRIDDPVAHQSVIAERTMLASLLGGCLAPVGAWGRVEDDGQLHLSACVLSADGKRRLAVDLLGNAADAEALGRPAPQKLPACGGRREIHRTTQ